MEADVMVKHLVVNPCCASLKEKYTKLEALRNALRQGVKIQNELIDRLQNENLNLKKAYEEEKLQADAERNEKANESAIRVSLENKISALKCEIQMLQQTGGSQAKDVDVEVTSLRTRLSKLETEMNQLEELIQKERMNADSERRRAEAENKEASEARKIVKTEKKKADEQRRLADIERKKVEELQIQLEKLKSEADEARSKLVSEAFKSEEVNKKLDAEKQKVIKEKKRADFEVEKAEEQRKLAAINQKNAMDEKCRADYLSQQLEEHSQRIEKLQKEINELVSLRKIEAPADLSDTHMNAETAKVKGELHLEILERGADESKLVLEYLKSKHANKRIKEEKQKGNREKKRADSKTRKLEQQRKVAEANRMMAMEEKHRADQFAQQLGDYTRRIEELQNRILELESSRTLIEAPAVLPDNNMNSETAEIKLLRKQLKFKKKQVKHAKEVAKLETGRNNILHQEFCCLRQKFVQLLHHLDVLNDCFSHCSAGRDGVEKTVNFFNIPNLNSRRELFRRKPQERHLHCNNELAKPSCTAMDASDCIKQTIDCNVSLLPTSGANLTQCISGTDSKLEPLLRGSNRKMLQSSAIYSSTASFSDRPLLGSQERGDFSVTTSAKLAEEKSNSQPNISTLASEVIKTRYNENLAVVAENSVRNPISIDAFGRRVGHNKKRKRILNAVKSIEHLYSKGRKCHLQMEEKLSMLHGMLNGQMDKSLQEERFMVANVECDPYAEEVRAHKKRKQSPKDKVDLLHFCDSNKRKDELATRGFEDVNICPQTFSRTNDMRETDQACKDGICDSSRSSLENLGSFEETMEGNYMKLLDLDNAVDEDCYRRAIDMPLSPTLPVLEFQSSGTFEMDKSKHLVDESSYDVFLSEKDNQMPSCCFDVVNVEIDSNKLKFYTSETSHVSSMCETDGALYPLKNIAGNENGLANTVDNDNSCAQQMWDSCAGLGMPDLYSSGFKEINISCRSAIGLAHDELPRYCVVFSDNKDSRSISRIFRATGTCAAQCSMISWTDHLMQKIMLTLLKIEDLLPKEKACVFFSVLLHNFSGMALDNFGIFLSTDSILLLDSFAGCLDTVMSDVKTRSLFAELCFFGELLTLIEDFLIDREVLICGIVSSESLPLSGLRVNILLNEAEIILSQSMAPTHQLVAGGIVLASICAAIDNVGFLCEASYNIFRMLDTPLMLTILHVFAYVCGSNYFNLKDYSLIMTVMKSLVTFLERANLSRDYTCCLPSAGEVHPEFPLCNKCPFSEGAVSMDIVVSRLFENLQNYALSGVVRRDPIESVNLLNSESLSCNEKIKETSGHEGAFGFLFVNCSTSCGLNKFCMPTAQSNSVCDENMLHFTDVLSLVELVAINMRWDWTCNNILPRILKLWESCVLENFSIVTVILLGKLGRLGVDASGYRDIGVENLKNSLSAFLFQNASRKSGLSVQIATVNALLGLLPLDCGELIKSNVEIPAAISQSDPAYCIMKWYSMLTSEQQSLSFSLLQSASVHSCRAI